MQIDRSLGRELEAESPEGAGRRPRLSCWSRSWARDKARCWHTGCLNMNMWKVDSGHLGSCIWFGVQESGPHTRYLAEVEMLQKMMLRTCLMLSRGGALRSVLNGICGRRKGLECPLRVMGRSGMKMRSHPQTIYDLQPKCPADSLCQPQQQAHMPLPLLPQIMSA